MTNVETGPFWACSIIKSIIKGGEKWMVDPDLHLYYSTLFIEKSSLNKK
jgi:hypothetical protein